MKLNIRQSAIKNLSNIDFGAKEKINIKILELKQFPNISNIKKLTNFEPAYRFRIGDYRVLFDVIDDTIEIGRILYRKKSYKQTKK